MSQAESTAHPFILLISKTVHFPSNLPSFSASSKHSAKYQENTSLVQYGVVPRTFLRNERDQNLVSIVKAEDLFISRNVMRSKAPKETKSQL